MPEGSGLSPNDIWIKVIEGETTKYVRKAGSDGSFAVSGLDASKKYDVLFTSIEPEQMNYSRALESRAAEDTEGYGGWLNQVSAAINEGNDVGSVKMKPMGTIKGVALIDGESEHYDITVYVPGTSFIARTAADGSFSMFNVPQGTYRLRYALASHVSVMSDEFIMTSGGSETEHPITTVPTVTLISDSGSVEGVATLDGAVDNSGIIIKLEKDDLSYSYTATTSENGSFTINGVRPGSYRLLASYAGYPTQTSNYFTVSVATTTTIPESLVLFENVGGISGSAGLADNEMVKAGIMIICRNLDTDIAYSTVTNEEGVFQRVLPSGNYGITASYPGYSSQTAEVEVLMGGSSTVTLAALVSADGAVSGRIVLDGALDSSGAVVTVTCASDSSITRNAVTDINGVFRIYGLSKAGQYYIDASKEGYLSSSSAVDVSLGTVAEASVITLKSRMSKISGTVTLTGTTNHTGINVLIKAKDNSRQYDATTAQDGTYVMASVLPGVYDLYASKAGYESKASADITIEPSSVKTIDSISLAVAQRSIYGNVQLELRTDHAGALITATKTSDPNKVYSAISNSAGDYSLAGMEPGEYRVVITSSGYRTLTLPTTDVIANSTANLETVDLIVARGTISGIVTLEGRSSQEGTRVELLGTGYETVTNELGEYSFSVPQGNYPGGIRFTKSDFKADSHADTIPVLTDSTYAVPARELKATHVSVYGTVDVQGTDDDSAVTISFDNDTHPEVLTTDETGSFRFDHVVLGSHTIRFSRDNAPDVTVQVDARASDGINVGTVKLTPNSASIHGIVRLKDATSYSGVKVEVDVQDKGKMSTFTGAGGDYYIGGIYSIGTHTVTYGKDGWDSQSTTVSGLAPLEDREMGEVTLTDTTPPVLNSITINSGANTAANKTVTLHVDATEPGSGISKMQISYDNVFDQTVTMRDYSPSFGWELPSGNGLKTVYMKLYDASGNASNVVSASVTLTDQKKEVWGVLTGEDLHWTKEMSPYLVTGNILVEKERTLTIDPGVDVQFPGAYFLRIEGTLRAIGTEEERISFYGMDNAEWNGINGVNAAGNRLSHVSITHLRDGIQGYVDIDHSVISSVSGYVLGASSYDREFRGTARENEIVGKIRTNEASLLRNNIQDEGANFERTFLSGNEFSGGNSTIEIRYSLGENNKFEGKVLRLSNSGMANNTFTSCNLSINEGGLHTRNSYSDCDFNTFNPAKVIDSNLINCGLISITASRSSYEELDMTGNFWGYDKTREMTEKGISSNLSFINDYYDDFNMTKVVYTDYKTEPISGVGYLGDAYYPIVAESPTVYGIGDTGPAGGIVFHDKGFYSEGWRYLEAASADLDGSIIFGYYKATSNSTIQISGTATGIGSGRTNTRMLVETMGDQAYTSEERGNGTRSSEYASKLCQYYEANGYADWFLPSKDELNQMYRNLYLNNLGGFSDIYYRSSSEYFDYLAWGQYFDDGTQNLSVRGYESRVRPVRAF